MDFILDRDENPHNREILGIVIDFLKKENMALLRDTVFKLYETLDEKQQKIVIEFIININKKIDKRLELITEIITKLQKFTVEILLNIYLYLLKLKNDLFYSIPEKPRECKFSYKTRETCDYDFFQELDISDKESFTKEQLLIKIRELLELKNLDINNFYIKFSLLKELLTVNKKSDFRGISLTPLEIFNLIFINLELFFKKDKIEWSIIKYLIFTTTNISQKIIDIMNNIYPFMIEHNEDIIDDVYFYIIINYGNHSLNNNNELTSMSISVLKKTFLAFLEKFIIPINIYKELMGVKLNEQRIIKRILSIIAKILEDKNYNSSNYITEFSYLKEHKYSLPFFKYFVFYKITTISINTAIDNYIKLFFVAQINNLRDMDKLHKVSSSHRLIDKEDWSDELHEAIRLDTEQQPGFITRYLYK